MDVPSEAGMGELEISVLAGKGERFSNSVTWELQSSEEIWDNYLFKIGVRRTGLAQRPGSRHTGSTLPRWQALPFCNHCFPCPSFWRGLLWRKGAGYTILHLLMQYLEAPHCPWAPQANAALFPITCGLNDPSQWPCSIFYPEDNGY